MMLKIINAITKANKEVSEKSRASESQIVSILKIMISMDGEITVEGIQDFID